VQSISNTPFTNNTIIPEDLSEYVVDGIVPGYEDIRLSEYINSIAKYVDGSWLLYYPPTETYIKVADEFDSHHDEKVYSFDGNEWIDVQQFTIPISIHAKIRIARTANMSYTALVNTIKDSLIEHFTPKMGMDRPLDRSEIIQIIREVDYVTYCELVTPELNIRFNYDIKDLTQKQLLDYTPQYVGFTEDSIDIEIISSE
jgi:hypothetical protein